MSRIHSFPPIADLSARKLVLGSMPGKASLSAGQYYAHPRNLFWHLMEEILEIPKSLTYEERCEGLKLKHLAVWDVLHTCTRDSSLDSDIDESSIVPNNFSQFLGNHSSITTVYFNGAKAEQVYLRHILPTLPEELQTLQRVRLPSTSPANASINYETKLEQWRVLGSL
ncbi:G/U mismatch-specific uracil-DNA glycosylase [Rubritalea squalenifaciens DSM 18772]|uniref:G/U mismatch-specific uracil-DNA glycosylase n=1 Tax=Rubritalea squalenifaciens DSM 18772 TaxID=1123071 RepID=A0A1M6LZF6_9BACT|nr:DNA-deoxyinosine glycosylase [Rubritalea squalenifaciens]SHJ76609.1 G/U mismatch-specific uracil-DNA glycosylase [Rubritalea squalenifaciens DSM 18772]